MSEQIDSGAFGAVRAGLDEALAEAGALLAQAFEQNDDEAQGRARTRFDAVRGVLSVANVPGAALLAEELTTSLLSPVQDGGAREAVLRAYMQLKDYLEGVATVCLDVPALIAPIVNDLRALRGVEPCAIPDVVPDDEARVDVLRASLSGRNRALRDSVQAALGEELARVQERIEVLACASEHDTADVAGIVAALGHIAATLEVAGLATQSAQLHAHSEYLSSLAAGEAARDEARLLDLASVLLSIAPALQDVPAAPAEFASGRALVIEVAQGDVERLKAHSMNLAQDGESARFAEICAALAGSLDFIGLNKAASLCTRLGTCVATAQAGRHDECIALAIGAIEYYLEGALTGADRAEALTLAESELAAFDAAPDAAPAPVSAAVVAEEADPEIVEIFIEEAAEEQARLAEHFPLWRGDNADRDALTVVRRSFHTLKGSGRMAGAKLIGELAWAVENLLNRVLDDTVRASAAIIAAVEETLGLLPTLVAALSNPHIVTPAVDELVARCRALADPNTATTEGSGESVMDTTLFEIFARESATHLDAIEAYLAHAADTGARAPDESLLRALHTLHGSASLAQVESIAHIAGEAERFCKDIVAHGAMFGDEALAMLGEVVACCRLALEHLFDPTAQINCGALVARIHALPQPATATAEVDAELLELFLEEGVENLNACDEGVTHWLAAPRDLARVEAVQRALHTLKGGARMANLMHMGDLCHELESLLAAVAEGALAPSDRMFDTLHIAHDRLLAMLEQARKGVAQSAATDLLHEIEEIRRGIGARAPGEVAETSREDAAAAREAALAAILAAVKPEADAAEAVLAPVVALHDERRTNERTMQEQVRVRADVLDALVNHTGEVSIYRARLAQQMGAFRFNLNELTATVARLKEQLRRMEIETEAQIMHRYESAGGGFHAEFDPLELDRFSQMQQLSRGLQETAGDVTSLQGLFENLTRESETLLDQQSRVVTDIQENLLRARMVPFGNLAPRLRRVVRQACMELGKRAELVLVGAEGELDRSLIDHIVAPLEHLLRNAVAHGIEAPAVRRERGKSEVGRIDLTWARDGGEVVLTVSDDGAGIDHEAIRAKARERGLIAHDTQVSDHEALQFILESGFSTASEINQVAGRGVGMDVVNNEVRRIGGALEIESERGRGARFGIRLPFTLAINRALLVAHGEELYALPLASVDGIARLPAQALERHQREGTPILHAGQEYPVQSLGMLLGTQAAALGNARHVPVVLVKSGTQRAAWPVDSLMGNREVVVKSVGGQLATVRGVSGATILGDGRVVLILEAGALLRMGHARGTVMERFAAVPAPRAEANGVTVLVVDDSITVRKVTTRLLERNNITVLTAKDGMDAVSLLHEHVPDVILTDIEMPRMDGYELATYVRNDSRLRHVPIVMITSRTGDKHRNRAFEIGVNRYLGKPYQEHQLIEDIHTLVAQASGHA